MLKPFNRRYIGNKNKLSKEINKVLKTTGGESFLDLFAGTGSVAYNNIENFETIGLNDNLFHNFVIYNAFFSNKAYSKSKIEKLTKEMNGLKFKENIFSKTYGGKFFSKEDASKIWEARKLIENKKPMLSKREYYILVSVIIFGADKASRSVGHFESFLRSAKFKKVIFPKLSLDKFENKFKIFNDDSNKFVKMADFFDVVYIDPPYNSRQYAYFYHVLETIALFKLNDKTKLMGVSAKPDYVYEKASEYSKSKAPEAFEKLISDLKARKIIVSYNNTFDPKSSSSKNKISYDFIVETLKEKGKLTVKEIPYKFFNSGKTSFNKHIEYLFVVEVNND